MHQQAMKRRMVAGTMYAFGGQVITTIAALAGTALLARVLSPHDVGVYFISFSIVSMASVIAQLGLGQTIVRMLAESSSSPDTGQQREVIRKTFLLLAVSTGLLSILMYSFGLDILANSVFGIPAITELTGVLVLWFAMLAVRGLVSEGFRGLHDLRGATVFGDMTNRCLFLILMVTLWMCCTKASIRTVIALNVAALGVTAVAGLFALHRKALPQVAGSHLSAATLIAAAWPVLLTSVANAAYSQVDIWLVGALCDSRSVALYGAAGRLALLIPMPLIVLNTVTAPYIASLHSSGRRRELQVLLTRTTTFAALIAAGAVLLYLVAGELILRLVYGEAYVESYPLLAILALGQLVVVMMGPSGLTLTMTGQQGKLMIITALSVATVVLGGAVLIRVLGPLGMALASALVSSGATAVAAVIAAKSAGIWTNARAEALRPAAAVAGARELLQLMRAPRPTNDKQ